jgi:hypothetical protein
MALDASYKEPVSISIRVLYKVGGRLLRGNGNKRHTLVCWLKPHDFRTFNRSTTGLITTVAFTFTALGLLLFLRRCRRRPKKAEGSRKQLAGHALNHGNDVTSELRLHVVGDPENVTLRT